MERKFKDLIDRHHGILYKIGRSYSSNEADFRDLFQEILVQLWLSFPTFRGESSTGTWVYRVALNTAITFHKKQSNDRLTTGNDEKLLRLADHSWQNLEKEQKVGRQIDLLYKCIHQLKKDDRAVILLHLEGKTYEETADILGISISYVGVKLLRIKKRLYKLLKQQGYARI